MMSGGFCSSSMKAQVRTRWIKSYDCNLLGGCFLCRDRGRKDD